MSKRAKIRRSLRVILAVGLVGLWISGCDGASDSVPTDSGASGDGETDVETENGESQITPGDPDPDPDPVEAENAADMDVVESEPGPDGDGPMGGDLEAAEYGDDADMEPPPDDTPIVVVTFNVLCSFCNPSEYDPWEDRLAYFTDIFNRWDPDLIGLQELIWASEVEEMVALRPGYAALHFHDDEGEFLKDYPDSMILYREDRFELVENGFYWLSETPDVPWSGGWTEAQLWRLVAWAQLRQKSDGREFYFASTHVDNNSPNQEMSAPVILERTAGYAERMPVIVVGDFNSKPGSEAYTTLTKGVGGEGFRFINAFDIARDWSVETNQDPAPPYDVDSRIDHIFLDGGAGWACPRWIVDMYVYGENDRYPSDHYAIVAELEF